MHTGVISFCDRISFNIKSSDVKDHFLSVIEGQFKSRILQKHYFLLDAKNVSHLQQLPHWMCLRSNGNPYLLYFTRYEDVPIMIYIDKKVQPGYEKPRMILGKGKFPDTLFDGTLLDGEMVKCIHDKKQSWTFLINDVIAYKGKHLTHDVFPTRLQHAYAFLKEYEQDELFDVCEFQVKRYLPCTQENASILLEYSNELPYTNRGLYFWPMFLKYKPKLINFDDTLIKSVVRKVKDVTEFRLNPKTNDDATSVSSMSSSSSSASSSITPITTTHTPTDVSTTQEGQSLLWLRKTENPDVYDVFEKENATQKIGTAHVSKMSTSKLLRQTFKDVTIAVTLQWMCEWNEIFKKWTPLTLHSVQKLHAALASLGIS